MTVTKKILKSSNVDYTIYYNDLTHAIEILSTFLVRLQVKGYLFCRQFFFFVDDHTRVVLATESGNDDYINANHIMVSYLLNNLCTVDVVTTTMPIT